jgi:transposase
MGMYADMKQWTQIRQRALAKGESKRGILRETGMHWRTLEKILTHSEPPGYQQAQSRNRPKIGAFESRIEQILKDDLQMPRKQRHTAQRIFERLRDEHGYDGCYSAVKEAVRRMRATCQEVFVPLKHVPREAQVDFGHALARVDGQLRKVAFFVMALPHSDAFRAYERTSVIVTTNLPFEQWTEVMGSERLTGALLDRLTHRVTILEANGESYRLQDSKRRGKKKK